LDKDLRKVKKILKFPILPFGYLRVWPKDSEQRVADSVQDGKTV